MGGKHTLLTQWTQKQYIALYYHQKKFSEQDSHISPFSLHTLPPLRRSMHSIRNDSQATYIRHSKLTCPDPSKIIHTVKTQSNLGRWLAPGCCCHWQGFLTVTFLSPHCHSLIPSIQLTDEFPLRRHSLSQCSTKRSPHSIAEISGLLRERLQRLALVVTPFPAFAEVTRRCQIWADNWSIWKLQRWQALSPLRLPPRMGQGRNTSYFIPHFWEHFAPNKNNAKSTNLTVLESHKGLLCSLGVEKNTG